MVRSESQRFLERGNRFRVFLLLRVQVAEEIVGVRLVRSGLGGVLKSGDALLWIAEVFIGKAKVVPSVGILRAQARSFAKRGAGVFRLLLGEKSDAEVEAGDGELRVGSESALEIFLGVDGALLIEVGD